MAKRDGSRKDGRGIQLRGNVWWVNIANPVKGGKRIRHSIGTQDEEQAKHYHDKLKAELWEQKKLGAKPKRTWEEACVKWIKWKAVEGKRSIEDDKQKIAWFTQYLAGRELDTITKAEIRELVEEKLVENPPKGGRPRKGPPAKGTRNKYYAFIRSLLYAARDEWEWLDNAPKVKTYDTRKDRRIRYLKAPDINKLLAELPPHLIPVVIFSLATGLRMTNVVQLKWSEVDLELGVVMFKGERMKNAYPFGLPLNEAARMAVELQIGKHRDAVFTYAPARKNGMFGEPRPFREANGAAWYKALKRAGIEDFRYHDLRHTWASHLLQSGKVTLAELQAAGGWQSAETVRGYAHLDTEHLRPAMSVMDNILGGAAAVQKRANRVTAEHETDTVIKSGIAVASVSS